MPNSWVSCVLAGAVALALAGAAVVIVAAIAAAALVMEIVMDLWISAADSRAIARGEDPDVPIR